MATRLEMEQSYLTKPSTLLNSIFMSTVNTAAKTLTTVASSINTGEGERWKASDHFRYMLMLMIWVTLWVLRLFMDNFPCSLVSSPYRLPDGFSTVGSYDFSSSSSSSLIPSSPVSSLEMVLHEGFGNRFDGSSSTKAIGRALSHILALLNEIPATSRKYQFAVAMAEKIVTENALDGNVALRDINRTALSISFARTSNLLYRSLQSNNQAVEDTGTWHSRVIQSLPLGSYFLSYLKGLSFCVTSFFPSVGAFMSSPGKRNQLAIAGGGGGGGGDMAGDDESVVAEKLAQELLWITNKLRECEAVDVAVVQWSFATGLASLSVMANPRVQSYLVKISAILMKELLGQGEFESPRAVKFRLLALWLPLFCYASNGLTYPILSALEKLEVERVMEEVISTLPAIDQEIILTNWLQDFSISSSDWPNLQRSYDQWCRFSRKLLAQ